MSDFLGSKLVSPDIAVQCIQSGDRVYIGSNCGAPQTLIQALFERRSTLHGVDIVHLLTEGIAPYAAPEVSESFRHQAFFFGKNVRQYTPGEHLDYIPVFLSEIPNLFQNGQLPIDVAMVSVTAPDEHGFCSLGVSVDIGLAACRNARYVLAEIHPHMPRTLGESFLHVSEIDFIVNGTFPILEHAVEPSDEVSERIARYIVDLIEDGATLQAGIGKIPNSVMALLETKNDLGVHTEMFSDGILPPIARGNINCLRKNVNRGKVVSSFCLGTKKIYEAIDNNPFFEFRPSEYVNDPMVISRNDRAVAINSAIQIDLTGQVVSDSMGHCIFSGIGGQVDFIRGAARSKGGKPIIALPSTAKKGTLSRITHELTAGAGVVTSRGDVHYVVTEFGVAYLHGKPIRERALSLIRIAHPDFRDELLERAKDVGVIPRRYESLNHPYPDELVERLVLKDGVTLTIRPIKATDESLLKDHFYALGEESRTMRFGMPVRSLSTKSFTELVNIDYNDEMCLVGTVWDGESEMILGVSRYFVNRTTNYAELAMAVRDEWQGKGIGSALFKRLVAHAEKSRLKGILALTHAENARMVRLLAESGYDYESSPQDGQVLFKLHFAKKPVHGALPEDRPEGKNSQ